MKKQLSNLRLGGIVLIVMGIMLSACAPTASAPSLCPTSCPPEQNAYAAPISQNLIDIYEKGVISVGDTTAYNGIRQQAFNELLNHVYSLSDSVEIQTDEKNIRIISTYIDPELVHIIIVNHYLYKGYTNFSGRLNEQVLSHVSGIVRRDEHVFFMTFTESTYGNNTSSIIGFPLEQFKLTNTNNTTTIPAHDDYNLEVPLILKNGPEYGFVYFPMAVIQNEICQAVLDKNRDTRIVLSVPSIVIDGTDMGSQSWEYKYAPLIDMTNISDVHQNKFSLALSADQYAPRMSTLTTVDLESPFFLGRFGSYHLVRNNFGSIIFFLRALCALCGSR